MAVSSRAGRRTTPVVVLAALALSWLVVLGAAVSLSGAATPPGPVIFLPGQTLHGGSPATGGAPSPSAPVAPTPGGTGQGSAPLADATNVPPVVLTPGENVQAIVASHPPGTSFTLAAGTFEAFSVQPLTGDTFRAQPGTVLDGEGTTAVAFSAACANDVTVAGAGIGHPLVIENYNDGHMVLRGTIDPLCWSAPDGFASGWTLSDTQILGSYSRGVTVGDQMTITHCLVANNGELGIGGGGADAVILDNTVRQNAMTPPPGGLDPGGIKVTGAGDQITGNRVVDNAGPGIWTDVDATDDVIDGNNSSNNAGAGIRVEISHGTLVENNTALHNGAWGIVVLDSDHVKVIGNALSGDQNGVVLGGGGRGTDPENGVVRTDLDDHVTSNTIVDSGHSGLGEADPGGVVFDFNNYTGTNRLVWQGQVVSFSQWQRAGLDAHGSFVPPSS